MRRRPRGPVDQLLRTTAQMLVTAMLLHAANASATDNLSVEKIAPGVWVHTSWQTLGNGMRFPANGLLVEHDDALIMVDTAWGKERTLELLDWIDSAIKQPVAMAIVTHFHADSMGGADVLTARGIPVLAHPKTAVIATDRGLPAPDPIDGLLSSDAVELATVEVFYPGPGHSVDNIVVWVPSAQVLYGTCAVRSPDFPGKGNTADADVTNWPLAIRRVRSRYPEVAIVVPGHGPAGGVELLTHTIDVLEVEPHGGR